jgi:hypothetical protein
MYYFNILRKTKYISTDLKTGERCYSCKDKMDIDRMDILDILVHDKKNYRLCKSCERDEKLDGLINKDKSSRLHKLKLYLIGTEFDKTTRILLTSIVLFLIIDMILKLKFDIKWFSYFYNTFLALYWLLMIYRHRIISIKKPSE